MQAMRVAVGVGDGGASVNVGCGFQVGAEVGASNGFEVAVGAVVATSGVGVFVEVAHTPKSNRPVQIPKIKGNRVQLMPPVYNGFYVQFSTLVRRLSGDYSPICHSA